LVLLPEKPEGLTGQTGQGVFNGQIVLLEYTVTPATIKPGGTLTIRLDWATRSVLGEDFTIFTHLVDAQGKMIGQIDRQPAEGDWPTSLWLPNQIWHDSYTLTLTPDAPAGPAYIEIGFYRLADGTRLPLDAGGDTLRLGTDVEVQP
jgi:hypothetical protein